jgi:hypothetical protein
VSINDAGTLCLSLPPVAGGPEPNYTFVLAWDGFGFVAERRAVRH